MLMSQDKNLSTETRLIGVIADILRHDASIIKPAAKIESLGLDSITMVELVHRFEREFEIAVPLTVFYECKSVADVVEWIDKQERI